MALHYGVIVYPAGEVNHFEVFRWGRLHWRDQLERRFASFVNAVTEDSPFAIYCNEIEEDERDEAESWNRNTSAEYLAKKLGCTLVPDEKGLGIRTVALVLSGGARRRGLDIGQLDKVRAILRGDLGLREKYLHEGDKLEESHSDDPSHYSSSDEEPLEDEKYDQRGRPKKYVPRLYW